MANSFVVQTLEQRLTGAQPGETYSEWSTRTYGPHTMVVYQGQWITDSGDDYDSDDIVYSRLFMTKQAAQQWRREQIAKYDLDPSNVSVEELRVY